MPIEAPISELGLFELFQLISLSDKNGILVLSDSLHEKDYNLYFENGNLEYIDVSSRLEEELIRRGIITEKDIKELSDNEVIKFIIENQIMKGNTLSLIYEQIAKDVVYSLFFIDSGHFSFKESEFDIPCSIHLGMRIENIILEAARRMDEISKMEEVIPSRDIILEVSSDIEKMDAINLGRMEWRLLSLIDGKRTISDLISQIGDEFNILKSLYGMIMTGIVTEKRIDVDNIFHKSDRDSKTLESSMEKLERFWNKGKYKKGIRTLKDLREKYPNNPRIVYELGYFSIASGKFKKAVSEWNTFILLSKDEKKKEEIKRNLELIQDIQKLILNREVSK